MTLAMPGIASPTYVCMKSEGGFVEATAGA